MIRVALRPIWAGVGLALGSAGAMTVRALERLRPAEEGTPSEPRASSHTPFGGLAVARGFGGAVDSLALAGMKTPRRFPTVSDYHRLQEEIETLHALYSGLGFIEDPASFHREPPPLEEPTIRSAWYPKLPYECLSFESGYSPVPEDTAGQRWRRHHGNRTAHAWVVRHPEDGTPRPWLMCLHGLGTGTPWLDFPSFRAFHYHKELGFNLIFPVLPLHGPRRDPGMLHGSLLSFDMTETIHGMAQAVWDIRQLLGWMRRQGAQTIAVHGISMGAYAAALCASHEDFDLIIAGIPLCDVPRLFTRHSPRRYLETAARHDALGPRLQDLYRLVTALEGAPRVPRENRFIYAGLADRISTPFQAELLWESWEKPEICWYNGGHVSFFWSRQVDRFVETAMHRLVPAGRRQ